MAGTGLLPARIPPGVPEAWAPMRRVPGEESARGATQSPASPAGPADEQQVNRSGNGG